LLMQTHPIRFWQGGVITLYGAVGLDSLNLKPITTLPPELKNDWKHIGFTEDGAGLLHMQ
ncbi:hypothetical protein GWO43_31490, partial [candidate division KSB1 bacterium]|nr:hypothetical protein [candidate division KSB1 bacterium]NIR73434.1 hypothetical protein [candidate division KSB1 bacterium]NIS28425.1 hypothetical protein [candidate division KSB1 bacterium]NIT75305.1 hypothetical protein [candidate division KSB1 bacterium]NIU29153.1 hypothetical protein [candidate division KSB1 bacterium]